MDHFFDVMARHRTGLAEFRLDIHRQGTRRILHHLVQAATYEDKSCSRAA
jgi:hypothetical protein